MPPVLPLLLALLGSTPPAPAAKSLPHPTVVTACAAATREEIQKAIGVPLEFGVEQRTGNESTCTFEGQGGQVVITLLRAGAPLNVTQEVEALKIVFPQAKLRITPVAGTPAVVVDFQADGLQVHLVKAGRNYLMVSLLGFGTADQVYPAAEKIARLSLSRL